MKNVISVLSIFFLLITANAGWTFSIETELLGTWIIQSDEDFSIEADFRADGTVITVVRYENGKSSSAKNYSYTVTGKIIVINGLGKYKHNNFQAAEYELIEGRKNMLYLRYNMTTGTWQKKLN